MKDFEETNSEIFNLVKKEKEVEYNGLYLRLETSDLRIRESIAKLKSEYGLIFITNKKISLTEKGEKHKDFESYLKSLNKKSIDLYKITSIIISLFALYLGYLNYNLKQSEKAKNDRVFELNIENTSLKESIEIYKDSLSKSTEKLSSLKRSELSGYKSSELISFYQDFKNEIIEIIWTDEPPAKLSGVIFVTNENKYFEIELDSIPKTYKMNLERNWKINEVGNSKIRNIKLIEKNTE